MMPVALYARVSTTDRGQDVEVQLRQLRAWAAQRGVPSVEFIDDGVSGSMRSRPALDKMMAECRRGRVSAVIIAAFDRLGRSSAHLAQMAEELRSLGVQLVSLREAVDTATPMGAAMFTISGAFAQLERDVIRDRVRHGLDAARARGVRLGRPQVEFDLDAARRLLASGLSPRRVSAALGVSRTTLRRRLAAKGEE